MDLAEYFDKLVVVETDNRKIFRGYVIDYLPSDENGTESIIIRNKKDNQLVELVQADIKSIETIK